MKEIDVSNLNKKAREIYERARSASAFKKSLPEGAKSMLSDIEHLLISAEAYRKNWSVYIQKYYDLENFIKEQESKLLDKIQEINNR